MQVDWEIKVVRSQEKEFVECLRENLSEEFMVDATTEQAILDLVMSNEADLIREQKVKEPLVDSDHNMVEFPCSLSKGEEVSVVTITKEKMLGKVKGLKVVKSSGPDRLHPRVLNELAEDIGKALVVIFQESLESGKIPNARKIADVTPLFKKGRRQKTGNYVLGPVSKERYAGLRSFIRMILGMKGLSYEEWVKTLDLFSTEFVRMRKNLTETYKILTGLEGERYFYHWE
eukprot:g30028.t1